MKYFYLIPLLFIGFACTSPKQTPTTNSIAKALHGFENLQDSTKTKVWWLHGNTESTKEGITADLESFKKQGIGGVVYYDLTFGECKGAFDAFSPQWWEMFLFAAKEAQRLGLTFETTLSNGYVGGGPWISPEFSMQKVTAIDTIVIGGNKQTIQLPTPQSRYKYYKDIAILAFPYNIEAEENKSLKPTITCNQSNINAKECFGKSNSLTVIPVPKNNASVLMTLKFPEPFIARSITYAMAPRGKAATDAMNVPGPATDKFTGTGYRELPNIGELEVSMDGIHFTKICGLEPVYQALGGWNQKTISFPATRGKYFRLNLHDWDTPHDRKDYLELGNVVLSSIARIDRWEEKAAFTSEYIELSHTPSYSNNETINSNEILDLTNQMDSLGILTWEAPKGIWKIVRFGHTPTGGRTKHGRNNFIGLECDKLSSSATIIHWNNYIKTIQDSIQNNNCKLHGIVVDSHEAGSQNWTPGFEKDFLKRRGYDLKKYLPALVGYIVDSVEQSEYFLYDIRRTIADLNADNFYGTLQRLCDKNGLILTSQNFGAICMAGDPIMAKGKVQKPQSEFWGHHPNGNYDIKECSSAAHLYNKPIASTEAFSDVKYTQSLADLKQLADYAYAFGINEFVGCASAHQPWIDKYPGSTGGGRHYALNRGNPLWEYSHDFWKFQQRTTYLMRQGIPVIDFCLYIGDNAPVRLLSHRLPQIPIGFDYDAFTTDALLTQMKVKEGHICLSNGMRYQLMIIPDNIEIPLRALRKIADLVEKGVSVWGKRPKGSVSLADWKEKEEYEKLADALWNNSAENKGVTSYGEGHVYWGIPLSEAIDMAGIIPDIDFPQERKLYFAHRHLEDGDIYFLDNHEDTPLSHTLTFRSQGKSVELWHPVTGERYIIPFSNLSESTTSVKLNMAARESYFVIFNRSKHISKLPLVDWETSNLQTCKIDKGWWVYFDSKYGGPDAVFLDRLTDWTHHTDHRVKYYSGTAIYKNEITIDSLSNQVYLNVNNSRWPVKIYINSQEVGYIWCSPWLIHITPYMKSGKNTIEIHASNSIINRMIYDSTIPEKERVTYAYPSVVSNKTTPISSGLKDVKLIFK